MFDLEDVAADDLDEAAGVLWGDEHDAEAALLLTESERDEARAQRNAALGDVARLRDALSGTLDLLACVWPQARNCRPTCNPIYSRAREILAGVTS